MKKFEEIYAPATEPITIANNANQALLKNHREWREAFHAVKVQNRELVDENKEFERENQRLRAENLMENAKKQQPEIPEVPQFVADWYKENKNDLEYGIYSIHVDISDTSREEMSDIENWFNSKAVKSIETIFAMKRLGYTVAKEKRYEVVFLEDDTTRQILMENNAGYYFIEEESENYGYWKQDFTEMEIKEINEKFWQLSVPVKDEQIEVEE